MKLSSREPEYLYFEIAADRAVFRLSGRTSLERIGQMVASAIVLAKERRVANLLVDVTGLTGFRPPTLAQRYFFARRLGDAAKGAIRLAMVARAEMLDPEQFEVTVATNRGLCAGIFLTEDEALAWLSAPPGEPVGTDSAARAGLEQAVPRQDSGEAAACLSAVSSAQCALVP